MTIWTADTPFVCNWGFDDQTDCAACLSKIEGNEALFQSAVNSAAEILYALSGRQFGLCEISLRPCRKTCAEGSAYGGTPWTPKLVDGEWMNLKCGTCKTDCSCTEICEILLPARAYDIVSVSLDGETLPQNFFRIDNQRKLVRTKQFAPLAGPTSMAFVNVPPPVLCDPSPTPDATTDFDPPVGGCYTGNQTNPSFQWNNASSAEATYSAASASASLAAFYNGFYPAGDAYNFGPVGTVLTTGQSLTSDPLPDGSFMRVTVVSGQATRVNTPFTWEIEPGTRLRMERLGEAPGGCWPLCQDMNADAGEPGSFVVTYHRGLPIPSAGERSLAQLSCELFLACIGDDCCALPSRVTSLTREGVTMAMLDPMEFISTGKTGLYSVDLWLQTVNPKALPRRSAILSPDMPQFRQQTWPSS